MTYLSFDEALGYCRSICLGLPSAPNAGLNFPAFWTDVMSAACIILNGRDPSSENAFIERRRRSGSGSALALILARLCTSNEASLSLASSSLESRCSGVGRFRMRDGLFTGFAERASKSLETDRDFRSCAFWLRSVEDWTRGDRVSEVCVADRTGAAGRVCTTLRICAFFGCSEKAPAPPF